VRFHRANGRNTFAAQARLVRRVRRGPGVARAGIRRAGRGVRTCAVDLSPEMAAYGLEKARTAQVALKYDCADMVTYQSTERYDIAAILMDSTSYLLTNDQVILHLKSVAQVLNPQGLYILVTQITQTSVRLEYQDGDRQGLIENQAPQRGFTCTEWDALVRASGCFEIVAWYGAMDPAVPLNNDKKSWRMIPVMKRLN
jgi:hypothetical protein